MSELGLMLEWVRGGRQLLSEAAITMYHGTSGRFLRRILKHGLQATPPERQKWAEHQESYGGAYITPYLQIAGRYAGDAQRKDGSDTEVIVVMRIETRSTHVVPDEDTFIRFTDTINLNMQGDLAKQFGWPAASATDLLSKEKDGAFDFNAWVKPWLERLNRDAGMSGGRSMTLSQEMVDRLMKHHRSELAHILKLILQYKAAEEYEKYTTSYDKEWKRDMLVDLGVPLSFKEARANFIKALDRFQSKIQQLASPKHELRSLLDITYRGKNRIIGVLSSRVGWTGSKPWEGERILRGTVIYGENNSATMEALKKISEGFENAVWQDRLGRVVWEK